MNRLLFAIIAFVALAVATHADEPVGEVTIQSIPFGPSSHWKANDTGATERSKFSIRIDERSAIKVTTNSAGSFINLPLTGTHLVRIRLDGKPLTDFRFSFEGRSNHLLLLYDESHGTWSLSDYKRAER